MAFMIQKTSDGVATDRLPLLKYDARAGRLFTVDRNQGSDGMWQSDATDITSLQPPFAVDFGCLEVGWSFFTAGSAPLWAMAHYGQPLPARPASPGNDDGGKALTFKGAFRVKVCGQAIGGVREFGGNASALIIGTNELHTKFEASPEAAAGRIPVVKMTGTLPIKTGQEDYAPVFEIVQWVDRPASLGIRTVPAPALPAAQAMVPAVPISNQSPVVSNHVPPPAAPVMPF